MAINAEKKLNEKMDFQTKVVFALGDIIKEVTAAHQNGVLDTDVCQGNWVQSIAAGNETVGGWTVAAMPNLNAYAAINFLLQVQQEGSVHTDSATVSYLWNAAAKFFEAAFKGFYPKDDPWGKECRKGDYESPLIIFKNGSSMDRYVANAVVKVALYRMSRMQLTPDNMRRASLDLQDITRMYQEGIIDAAKTALKVVIENLEGFKEVKMLCRDENYGIKFDWDKSQIELARPDGSEEEKAWKLKGGKHKKVWMNDLFNVARCDWLSDIKGFASRMVEIKQEFSEKTLAWLEAIGKDPKNKEVIQVCWFVKELYQTFTAGEHKEVHAAEEFYKDESLLALEAKRSIKEAYAPAFAALSNMLRCAYNSNGLSPVMGAACAIYACFFDKKGVKKAANSREVGSFAHVLLEQEFFLFVLRVNKDNADVPKWTENRLYGPDGANMPIGLVDGEEVEFNAGRFEADGKFANAKNLAVNGKFIIRCKTVENENGESKVTGWYACRSLEQLCLEAIPEPDYNQVVIQTAMTKQAEAELKANYDHVLQARAGENEIELRSYGKLANGEELHDNVILNGKKVLTYRGNLGRGAGQNEKGLNKLYDGLRGVVTASARFESVNDAGVAFEMAFLVIEKTAQVTEEDMGTPITYDAPVIQKPAARPCRMAFKNDLAKEGASAKEVVSAPTPSQKVSTFEKMAARNGVDVAADF